MGKASDSSRLTEKSTMFRIAMLSIKAAMVSGLLACTLTGIAQSAYPSRPIKVIVPLVPGASVDLVARRVSDGLSRQLGQPVTVENSAGGSGVIGANACKSAQPDGYTLCVLLSDTLVINPAIYKKLSKRLFTISGPSLKILV